MREGFSVPLIGPSHARALPHHCHITVDWLEESLPNHCRRRLTEKWQALLNCPPRPTRRNASPCLAPACTLPRPPGCQMPSRARRRGVCVPGTARDRASAREGGWAVSNRVAITSDSSGSETFPHFAKRAVTRACTRSPQSDRLHRDVCSGARAVLASLSYRLSPFPMRGRTSAPACPQPSCPRVTRQISRQASTAEIRSSPRPGTRVRHCHHFQSQSLPDF
jgi:hypothetical protein